MKSSASLLSCVATIGVLLALPGRAAADPVRLFADAFGSIDALSGRIFTQDSQTFISSNNANQLSAILEFDLAAFAGGPVGKSRLSGSIVVNNALETGVRRIGLSAYAGNLMVDIEDLDRPAIPIGTVSYHPPRDFAVGFSFDMTSTLNTLLRGGADSVGIRFDALNFQAPSAVTMPGSFGVTNLEISRAPEPSTLTLLTIAGAVGWARRVPRRTAATALPLASAGINPTDRPGTRACRAVPSRSA